MCQKLVSSDNSNCNYITIVVVCMQTLKFTCISQSVVRDKNLQIIKKNPENYIV